MSKCFLLGAGASYGYSDAKEGVLSPPMGGELFSRGEQLGLLNHGKFPNLDRVYSNYVDKYGRDNLDVEDVMIKSFSDDSRWPAGELMYYIYELFRFYALDYDHFIHTDNYQKLAELFYTEEYNVISINYDTLFEQDLVLKVYLLSTICIRILLTNLKTAKNSEGRARMIRKKHISTWLRYTAQ
jgi:hypothetical protein